MSDSEDPIDNIDDGGDDLFGDDDGDQPLSEVEDAPSDRDLASDRDEDEAREQQYGGDEEPLEFTNKTTQEVPMYRHRIPKSEDDSLISLRVPKFIKLNPLEYKSDTWEPTKWDTQNAMSDTPVPSVLFRRDPATGKMQSNANVYKWSDGSVTVAVGDEHYEIQAKPLAPPRDKPYKEVADTHYYAAAAHLTTNSLLVIGHFTEQYTVRPNAEVQDHALERLKAQIAEAKKERERDMMIVTVTEDPELQRKQAEQAEKEAMRAQRRRENAAARAEGTSSRFKGGSLSVGDLEGRRGAAGAGGRKRGAPGGSKKKHRKPEYDSDDDLPSGARQNDNYDMEDGFLVDSNDDDSEEVDDDDEEEDILDDEDEAEAPRKRQKTKAAPAPRPVVDEDADGEVDEDEPAQEATSSRRRRQHIIDDDDE